MELRAEIERANLKSMEELSLSKVSSAAFSSLLLIYLDYCGGLDRAARKERPSLLQS